MSHAALCIFFEEHFEQVLCPPDREVLRLYLS